MKLLAVFVTLAVLTSQGDCYGYDYEDDFGVQAYHPDYQGFEPEGRAMMLDKPDKKKMGGFRALDITTTPKPKGGFTRLEPTDPPKLTLKTFKPFTRRPKTNKPITARAIKNAPKKPPPKPLKLKKPVEDEEGEEEE